MHQRGAGQSLVVHRGCKVQTRCKQGAPSWVQPSCHPPFPLTLHALLSCLLVCLTFLPQGLNKSNISDSVQMAGG